MWLFVVFFGMVVVFVIMMCSVVGVLVFVVMVILSVMWMMGIVVVLGYKFNLFVIFVLILFFCVGIGDSMYVVVEFV